MVLAISVTLNGYFVKAIAACNGNCVLLLMPLFQSPPATLMGINAMLKHVHANAHAITSSELSDAELSLTGEREACLPRLLDELIRIFAEKGPKPTSVDLVLFTDEEGILLAAAYTLEKVLGNLERAYL
jgi:hypothetical protein